MKLVIFTIIINVMINSVSSNKQIKQKTTRYSLLLQM